MKRNLFALCALAALPLGCVYPAERGRMLEERVDRLEADKKDLDQELKKQKDKLDDQVAQVQAALDKLEKSAHRTGADIGVQMEQVQNDLSQLRGKLEEHQHQLVEVQGALDKLRPASVSTGGAPTAPGTADSGDAKKPDKKAEPAEKPTDRKGLAQLVEKTMADDPAAGRKLAEEWFRKFPKPEAAAEVKGWTPLASKVHFLLGSSLMAQKDCRGALAEFGEIVQSFGKSEDAPEALLKSADCFAALKMTKEARLALEEIGNSYPKSEAAKQAKSKLAELSKPKKK